MVNVKISDLTAATIVAAADVLPLVQGGVTKKTPVSGLPVSTAQAAADAAVQAAAIQRANHTGTQSADTLTDGTTNKILTAAERTKLAGIAAGATVNRADTATDAAIAAATAALVNSAPGTLDTLGELATALTADEGAAATLTTLVGTKAPLASPAFTGSPTIGGTAVAKTSDVAAAVAAQATSDAATYVPKATTKRATIVIGSDTTGNLGAFSDILQRMPVILPATTSRWRLRLANHAGSPITGAVNVGPIYLGTPAYTATGAWFGALTSTPTQVLNAPTMPTDGSDYVSPWVTDPGQQFVADAVTVISLGITTAPGQQLAFNGSNCAALFLDPGAAAAAATPAPTQGTNVGAFLDIRLEVEYVGRNRIVLVIADSTGSGATDDQALIPAVPSRLHAWPDLAAYRNRAFCLNASLSGRYYDQFTSLSDWAFTRFDLATTPPDDVILGMGINHANRQDSLATFQARAMTTLGLVKALNPKRIFMTTIMPQPQFAPGYLTTAAAVGATTVTTSTTYTSGSIIELGYGTPNHETVTVSGTPTANADGTYTATLTSPTAKTHAVYASAQYLSESRRQDYNTWIRTRPGGIVGVYDFEQPLQAGFAPQPGVPDMTLWGTGTVHPGASAYGRLAGLIDLRGATPEA